MMIETTILNYPCSFFAALFVLTLAAGAWIGFKFNEWRVLRLQLRIESLRLELSLLRPRRGMGLR